MRPGLISRSTDHPPPRPSIVPGEKFSSSTSARLTISNKSSRPRGCFRFRVTARLFWFSIANGNVALVPGRARRRNGSPDGGSTLITSAPPDASSNVAYGPWKICPKSITTSPASGSRADDLPDTGSVATDILLHLAYGPGPILHGRPTRAQAVGRADHPGIARDLMVSRASAGQPVTARRHRRVYARPFYPAPIGHAHRGNAPRRESRQWRTQPALDYHLGL